MAEVLERLEVALANRYAIERELGHGGMAVVYLAEDLKHHRHVALKVLLPDLAAALGSQRFLREIAIAATLAHPNILPLYDSGEADGLLYYAMPFVEGESLRDRLARDKQLPIADAIRITQEVADALGYAHAHDLIHRDIKPENILFEAGHAVVSDFGIARAVSAAGSATLTETGLAIGTPAYMSPEQASGSREVDGRSDLYSLGCVLYEMLSGETPYTGPTPLAILAKKLSEPLPRISVVRQTVPPSLEAVLAKVLANLPADRFSSASEFAAALSGKGFTPAARSRAGARARLVAAAAGAAVLLAAGAFALLSRSVGWQRRSAAENAIYTQLTSDPGEELYPSLSPDGKWLVYAGEATGNRDIYLLSVGGQNAIDLTADSPVNDDQPAFSPDGEHIAFRSEREGGGIFVMGRTGEDVKRVTHAGYRPTWSPDGTEIAYATENVEMNPEDAEGESQIWVADVRTGASRRLATGDGVLPSWSPHGYRIAFTKRGGHPFLVGLWTIAPGGGKPLAVSRDSATSWNPAWSPDGRYLYFASNRGGSMNLWRVRIDEKSGETLSDPEPITTPATRLAQISLAASGRRIAYSSVLLTANVQTLRLEPTSGSVIGDPGWVTSGSQRWSDPDPSPDGQWVAFYAIGQGHIYVARPDGTGRRQVNGDSANDRMPRWSPDGNRIAFFSNRGPRLQLWSIRSDGSELRQLTNADSGLSYPVWSPDGAHMAGSMQARSYVFDPNRPWTAQVPVVLPAPETSPTPWYVNDWSPDGRWICGAYGGHDQGILTYEVRTHRFERLTDHGEWPVWLPDSRHVLFVSGGKAFYVVDRATKQVRKVFTVSSDVIGPPRLTRDGRHAYYTRRVTEADIWLTTLR